ncbi:NADPH oxidoreductase A-like isoform X2 [Babylonia areolata]|uniref:NADPH oxidoreductase A-like isoform X2 n=1 Tax=Babylonia areolata TaxID=304850 RepID=UPI003FD64657
MGSVRSWPQFFLAGVFPTECRPFVVFLQKSCPPLSHVHFSLLALGDSSYPHFCRAGLQMADQLRELGAQEIVTATRVDGEDWGVIEGWMGQLESWISSREAEETCPDLRQDYLKMDDICDSGDSAGSGHNRQRPFLATLKVKHPLTHVEDVYADRETIHCELDIGGSGLVWTPGDSLGLYAQNNPLAVDSVLSVLALTGKEILPDVRPAFRGQGQMTAREALQWCYDIKKATRATLSVISQHPDTFLLSDRPWLSRLLSSKEECVAYLDSRRLVQVLRDWCGGPCLPSSPPVPVLHSLLTSLRPLQPRYYSISSSPLLDVNRLSLTVAVVRYMEEGREEGGVATTYLQDRLDVGQSLPVFVSSNPDFRLPPSPSTPILLISAGTGIAPFMAYIQTRELTNSQGDIHLYFGCRHPEKDFLYRQKIERWVASGVVCARVAFSRYQGRVYVQDLLKEDAVLVWKLLDEAGAVVYVCGDAGRFAPDVERTLESVIQQQGQRSASDAHTYLMDLQQASRYQKDVWLS